MYLKIYFLKFIYSQTCASGMGRELNRQYHFYSINRLINSNNILLSHPLETSLH